MKAFKVLAMTVAFFISGAVLADGRKEATIDLGKGAFKLTVSVPDFLDGPYDTAKNPGPRVNINNTDGKGYAYGELMYNSSYGETGVVVLEATATTNFAAKPAYKGALAESMAKTVIDDSGFGGRAVKFDCPPVPIEGATALCYKMSGDKVFNGKTRENKYAAVLVAVSFANDKHGYTLMGTIVERNVAKFNADPTETEKSANKSLSQLWKFHKVTTN